MGGATVAVGLGGFGLAGCGLRGRGLAGGERVEVRYGDHPRQVADLWLPRSGAAADRRGPPHPVAVLVGGGMFRAGEGRRAMVPLAADLGRRGVATYLVDHRVLGDGGGWPASFVDMALAVDRLALVAEREPVDVERVVGIGYETGATLLLWCAARDSLPADAGGGLPDDLTPEVRVRAVVSLAGVTSLGSAAFEGLAGGALAEAMGGVPSADGEDAYALADPSERLPLGVDQLLVAAEGDRYVPVGQATAYARRAADAGDTAATLIAPDRDHADLLEPSGRWWTEVQNWLAPHLDLA